MALPVFGRMNGGIGGIFFAGQVTTGSVWPRSLVASAHFEPNWRALKTEGGANLIFEKALEGEVEFDVAVGEEDEGGGSDSGLGHIEDTNAFRHGDAGALEIDAIEEAVHLAGSDAFAALGGNAEDGVENAGDGAALSGGDEEDGCVAEVFKDAADLALENFAVGWWFSVGTRGGDEVPLIDNDDDGAATLVGVAADGSVGGGDTLGGVDDEERNVGGFEMTARHDDGELLGHEVGLPFAANAGGIDDAELVILVVN